MVQKSITTQRDFQEGFSNALKIGYLDTPPNTVSSRGILRTLFSSAWPQHFFVLTNIGLLGFYTAISETPFCLVPVIGCTLVQTLRKDRRHYCFKLISSHQQKEFVFSTSSLVEKQSWVGCLQRLQEQGLKKK